MKQVVRKVLPALAVLVFMGAGCSNRGVEPTSNGNTTQPAGNKVAAMDCKMDETCADKVWADCQAGGSFTFVQNGITLTDVTVMGKEGTGCKVDWTYAEDYLKTAGPAGDMFRGKSMSCSVNSGAKTAMSGFGSFVESQMNVGFKDCNGALKDVLNQPPTGPATLID